MGLCDDSESGTHSLIGDMYALFTAVFYAVYSIIIAKMIKPEDEHKYSFFDILGWIGLISCVLSPVFVVVWNYTGIEHYESPTGAQFGFLALGIFLGNLMYDYFFA